MNYYYDIEICLQKDNTMFYEWMNKTYINKIQVIRVNDKTMIDFINNDIKICNKELDLCLFVSNIGSIIIEFNNDDISINRSFLQIQDEVNIQDILYTFKEEVVDYKLLNKKIHKDHLLREETIKSVIQEEISNLVNNNNYLKLKYLYYEWFNKDAKSKKILVSDMLSKLKEGIGQEEENIYKIIKDSINN